MKAGEKSGASPGSLHHLRRHHQNQVILAAVEAGFADRHAADVQRIVAAVFPPSYTSDAAETFKRGCASGYAPPLSVNLPAPGYVL